MPLDSQRGAHRECRCAPLCNGIWVDPANSLPVRLSGAGTSMRRFFWFLQRLLRKFVRALPLCLAFAFGGIIIGSLEKRGWDTRLDSEKMTEFMVRTDLESLLDDSHIHAKVIEFRCVGSNIASWHRERPRWGADGQVGSKELPPIRRGNLPIYIAYEVEFEFFNRIEIRETLIIMFSEGNGVNAAGFAARNLSTKVFQKGERLKGAACLTTKSAGIGGS